MPILKGPWRVLAGNPTTVLGSHDNAESLAPLVFEYLVVMCMKPVIILRTTDRWDLGYY